MKKETVSAARVCETLAIERSCSGRNMFSNVFLFLLLFVGCVSAVSFHCGPLEEPRQLKSIDGYLGRCESKMLFCELI